jgi:hypothetical protein
VVPEADSTSVAMLVSSDITLAPGQDQAVTVVLGPVPGALQVLDDVLASWTSKSDQ